MTNGVGEGRRSSAKSTIWGGDTFFPSSQGKRGGPEKTKLKLTERHGVAEEGGKQSVVVLTLGSWGGTKVRGGVKKPRKRGGLKEMKRKPTNKGEK